MRAAAVLLLVLLVSPDAIARRTRRGKHSEQKAESAQEKQRATKTKKAQPTQEISIEAVTLSGRVLRFPPELTPSFPPIATSPLVQPGYRFRSERSNAAAAMK